MSGTHSVKISTLFLSILLTRLSIPVCHAVRVGNNLSTFKCPPKFSPVSNSRTLCPASAAVPENLRPAGPPPITDIALRFLASTFEMVPEPNFSSRPIAGF